MKLQGKFVTIGRQEAKYLYDEMVKAKVNHITVDTGLVWKDD